MEDSFIGQKFGVDGHLEVIEWDGSLSNRSRMYTVRCSTCAKDAELFGGGLFKSMKSGLVRGAIPCGCSSSVSWSKEQYIVRVQRECSVRGYTFNGFAGEYVGNKTKLKLTCLSDGYYWETCAIGTFLLGAGCPVCTGHKPFTQEQREDQINNLMEGTNLSFVRWVGEYINVHSMFVVMCSLHGEYTVSISNFIYSKSGCPSCAKHGFDPTKPAHVYVLDVQGEVNFCGYGISNVLHSRLSEHKSALKKEGFTIEGYKAFPVTGHEAIIIEKSIQNRFVLTPQSVKGFRKESTSHTNLEDVYAFVEEHIESLLTSNRACYYVSP